jgi:hypothetical protein
MNAIESFLDGLDHLRAMVDPWHRMQPTAAQRADVAAQMIGMLRVLERAGAAEDATQEVSA